jgi:DNA mismatch repair ATPase MutS
MPDCKGKESLFEAEMYRCKENIDFVRDNVDKKSIVFMDEIFNSTNAIEGISGAYSILKNLAKYENTSVIITTHFPYLAKLHKDSNFSLYKFDSIKNESNMIDYTYKISKGLSKQYIALEILREHAFDEEIISEANRVKEYILHG